MMKFVRRFGLEIAVFVCGSLVMIFEINGSRIMAPYLGTSTYIWTSLIGVILAALSVGYWIGGRIADRTPKVAVLASAVFLAGGLVSVTILLKDVVLGLLVSMSAGLELKALIAAILLFAPASVAFGFVLPFAVKLRLSSLSESGSTVGRLYALSTVGSIVGTFLAGFVLLPSLGSVRTMYLIAGTLFAVSLVLAPLVFKPVHFSSIVIFVFGIAATEAIAHFMWTYNRVFAVDTEYARLTLFQPDDPKTGKKIQALSNDPYFVQSAVFLDSDELVFDYNRFFHLAGYYRGGLKNSLMIGGAGYTFPRDHLRKYPEASIDVVEIDPGMTQIAREYFRLQDDPKMTVFHADARVFLNSAPAGKYDVIFLDAFGTLFSVPYQLTTVEAARAMKNALNDDGILVANVGAALTGEADMFLRAELATWRAVFHEVKVFKVKRDRGDAELQNLVLIAFKQPPVPSPAASDFASLLEHEVINKASGSLPILTDDLAPVEYYNSIAQRHYRIIDPK